MTDIDAEALDAYSRVVNPLSSVYSITTSSGPVGWACPSGDGSVSPRP